jgi:hypothetical protein
VATVSVTPHVVQDIVDSADERELWIVGREFERPPYFHAGKGGDTRLARALRVCIEGRVTPNSDGSYQVEGSEHRSYRVGDSCSCPQSQKANSKFCYHMVAVALYVEWQRRLKPLAPTFSPVTLGTLHASTAPLGQSWMTATPPPPRGVAPMDTASPVDDETLPLPLAPVTVDERLAQAPTLPQEDRMVDDDASYIPEPDTDDAPGAILEPPAHTSARTPAATWASVRRSIHSIVADLSRPLPDACVAHKVLKGKDIPFLTWPTVAQLLDAYAPGWQGQITRIDQLGTSCAITYRLTIPCAEGEVSREATGQETEDVEAYGDPTSNAEAMAFKRAAAKFGVGQWLYSKDHTRDALASHLRAEKASLLQTFKAQCHARGVDGAPLLARLKAETQSARNVDLPLQALQALVTQGSTAQEVAL